MNKYFNIFPNSKTIASYNTFSQIIELNSFEAKEFTDYIGQLPNSESHIYRASIFRHEMAHWIDHISTLWGHTKILQLYNALNAKATNDLNEFWRIKMYADSCKEETLFEYFTQIYNSINGSKYNRWKYTLTSGYRFLSNGYINPKKPILFTRFLSYDDIPIARVPISIVSILETIATYEEFKLRFLSIEFIEDITEKKRLEKVFEKDLFEIIYNSNLTLYNVVSHLTANMTKVSDIISTLETASKIGTIVLNLTREHQHKVDYVNTPYDNINDRIESFKESGDKGYLFYSLLTNLVNGNGGGTDTYKLDYILQYSNLPKDNVIEDDVIHSMSQNIQNLIPGPFYLKAKKILEAGIEIFKKRGIDGNKDKNSFKIENFPIRPRIMFGDTLFDDSKFNLGESLSKLKEGKELNLDEEYFIFDYYNDKINEFVSICGI